MGGPGGSQEYFLKYIIRFYQNSPMVTWFASVQSVRQKMVTNNVLMPKMNKFCNYQAFCNWGEETLLAACWRPENFSL